jgi:hypothetical protein
MLSKGLDISLVMDITGISYDKLQGLLSSVK